MQRCPAAGLCRASRNGLFHCRQPTFSRHLSAVPRSRAFFLRGYVLCRSPDPGVFPPWIRSIPFPSQRRSPGPGFFSSVDTFSAVSRTRAFFFRGYVLHRFHRFPCRQPTFSRDLTPVPWSQAFILRGYVFLRSTVSMGVSPRFCAISVPFSVRIRFASVHTFSTLPPVPWVLACVFVLTPCRSPSGAVFPPCIRFPPFSWVLTHVFVLS